MSEQWLREQIIILISCAEHKELSAIWHFASALIQLDKQGVGK